jgi:hydrogenase nickel incorporation protein HypB
MCTVCGCGQGETTIEGHEHGHGEHGHEHRHADGTVHSHPHHHDGPHDAELAHDHAHGGPAHQHGHRHGDGTWHDHSHVHEGDHSHAHDERHIDFGAGPAGAAVAGMSQARMVQVEQDILGKNNAYAAANRRRFADRGIFAVNLVSSPGSGKTTLLVRTIEALKARRAIGVVEGDQQTSFDAERIRATGVPAIQINTGKGCHLDAHMVGHAWEGLRLPDNALLLIENVGNLVCPAEFDLGEAHKVVILSVTEGEDKPLKYPNMFRAADLMILNKVDLLPHLSFDVERCLEMARRVNPHIEILKVSATSGAGLDSWLAWLERGLEVAKAARAGTVDQLRQRIADLEAQLAARQS